MLWAGSWPYHVLWQNSVLRKSDHDMLWAGSWPYHVLYNTPHDDNLTNTSKRHSRITINHHTTLYVTWWLSCRHITLRMSWDRICRVALIAWTYKTADQCTDVPRLITWCIFVYMNWYYLYRLLFVFQCIVVMQYATMVTLTKHNIVLWRHMASLGRNKLNKYVMLHYLVTHSLIPEDMFNIEIP